MPPPDWFSWEFWARDSQGLYHLALIAAGVIGIPLLAIRTFAAHRQARTAEQGHITDRFTKAVEQLGSEKMTVRLGAVYALERISRDSRRDYWPIMETLTTYVRENAPWPPRQALANPLVALQGSSAGEAAGESTPAEQPEKGAEPARIQVRPATDIQAILTVLRRRDKQTHKRDKAAGRSVDLVGTDLRGARLWRAHLEHADLTGAHLEGADLTGAHLEHADLTGAHLEGARLWRAHLEDADLTGAHLEGANFYGVQIEHAFLGRPILRKLEAVGLTREQLKKASGDNRTILPAGLTRPAHWPAAPPHNPQ
jgi:Pentapeptide repeats (8 copies)